MQSALRPKDVPSEPPARAGGIAAREGVVRLLASLFALQDVIFLLFYGIFAILVARSPAGPNHDDCARRIYLSIAALVIGCVVGRGLPRLPHLLRAAVYRLAIVGVLIASYLMLRDLLPQVRTDAVDEALLQLDYRLFGVEPALWLERYNQRPIIEWFSFFYFSYFAICFTYMAVVVWLSRPGRVTAEFAIGTALVFSIGQLGYAAVPGYGPVKHMADQFHGPIDGGLFWSWVTSTVDAGGAMKDIFPSLHTAVPLWFALFAREQAKTDRRWIWPARVTFFFSANIIFSTMLLRWHYVIDVIAGFSLALAVGLLTPRITRREEAWRASLGLSPPWILRDPPR
jgi:membrane-associated phospholipid phosphatase